MASFQQKRKCPKCEHITTAKKCTKCSANTVALPNWSVIFRIVNIDGKVIQKRLSGYKTKTEAQSGYNNFMASYIAPPKLNMIDKDITFNELYDNYLQYIYNRLKISSVYTKEKDFAKHILPYFGKMRLLDIDKKVVYAWQLKLEEQNYRYETKTKLRNHLSGILNYAVRYFDLPSNPIEKVEPFRKVNENKKIMNVWSESDFNLFIEFVDDLTYKTFFTFLYYIGCRKSEAFALSWKDINFMNKTVSINKTLTRKTNAGSYEVLNTPKTNAGNRTILMPSKVIELLIQLKDDSVQAEDFVFGGTKPLAENTVRRKLATYIEQAGVTPIHEHEFRLSHASLLISKGASIVLVSKRLGHSNIEETLNTYSHLMPSDEDKIISILEM